MVERKSGVGVWKVFGIVSILLVIIFSSVYVWKLVNPESFEGFSSKFMGASSENIGRVHPNSTNSSDSNNTSTNSGEAPSLPSNSSDGKRGVTWFFVVLILGGVGVALYFLIRASGGNILVKRELSVEEAIELCKSFAWYNLQWRPYNHTADFKESKDGYNVVESHNLELQKDSKGVPILVQLSCAPRTPDGKVTSYESITFSVRSDNPRSRFMWKKNCTLDDFYVWHYQRKKEGWSLQKTDLRDEQVEQLQFAKDKVFEKVVDDI